MSRFKSRKKASNGTSDSENRVVIKMNVSSDNDFLSVYSLTSTPVISEEVANFIEMSAESLNPKTPLTLRIYSKEIDEAEKPLYAKAISTYYKEKQQANKHRLIQNNIISAQFLLVGILVLLLDLVFHNVTGNAIGAEIIDIIAWVLIWEATDIFIFRNSELRKMKKRYDAFIDMKTEYHDIK